MSNFQITVYCGPSGIGKTECLKSRVMTHDGLVIVFDHGGSFQEAVQCLGGQVIEHFEQIEPGRPAYLVDFESLKTTPHDAVDLNALSDGLISELNRDTHERKLIVIDEVDLISTDVEPLIKEFEWRDDIEIAISAQDMRDVKNVKADRTVTFSK